MTKKNAKALLLKYQAGTATEDEKAFIDSWMLTGADSDIDLNDVELLNDLMEIRHGLAIDQPYGRTVRLWPRIAVAASIFIVLSFSTYFLLHKNRVEALNAQNRIHDIAAGGNKAVLTLSNGKKIVLTNAGNGLLVKQGNSTVSKTADGQLAYQAPSLTERAGTAAVYDTLTVPRGGQYQLKLADGSTVWLNAATCIRYPANFTGSERKVELIYGEADFQVKHNAAMPFKVLATGQTIEDIGTNFNINAYGDEPSVRTTLLEGAINVSLPKSFSSSVKNVMGLKPGQQLVLQPTTNTTSIKEVDADVVVDWKNGEFYFKNEPLPSIMRRVSRWYDVKIVYEGNKINPVTYSGSLPRFSSLSKILEKLQGSGDVLFKIDGKKVIILK